MHFSKCTIHYNKRKNSQKNLCMRLGSNDKEVLLHVAMYIPVFFKSITKRLHSLHVPYI